MEKKLSFIDCDIIIINNRNIVQLFLYVYLVHFLLLFCHKGEVTSEDGSYILVLVFLLYISQVIQAHG